MIWEMKGELGNEGRDWEMRRRFGRRREEGRRERWESEGRNGKEEGNRKRPSLFRFIFVRGNNIRVFIHRMIRNYISADDKRKGMLYKQTF